MISHVLVLDFAGFCNSGRRRGRLSGAEEGILPMGSRVGLGVNDVIVYAGHLFATFDLG